MSISMTTPNEMAKYIAHKMQAKRLSLNLTQQTVSARSGVSYGVIKKFESTGKISLNSLLKIALVLNALQEFEELFKQIPSVQFTSLDALINKKIRKRGSK